MMARGVDFQCDCRITVVAVAAGNACMHDEGDAAHVEGPAYVDGLARADGTARVVGLAQVETCGRHIVGCDCFGCVMSS